MSLFHLKATRASEFMRINYAHLRRAVACHRQARPFVSLSRRAKKKPHSARVATPRRENKGPRCLTVRHIRSRDLMSDAKMLRTGFALSDEKLSWCFVKNVAIMMKHHSVFGLDCFVDVSG